MVLATPAAIGSALLERVGGLGVLGGVGSTTARRIGGAAAGEALTEAGQSAIEYAGGSVGTDEGFKTSEALDQMLAGSVAGGIAGGGLRGSIEAGSKTARVAGERIASVVEARRGAKALDELAEMADESKLRKRDPEAFAGLLRALVPGQFAAATQFLVDVGYGEQEPETISDWYEGLTKGKIKEN